MKTSNNVKLDLDKRFESIPPLGRFPPNPMTQEKPHIKLTHKKEPDPNRTYFFHVREWHRGNILLNAGKTFAARIVGDKIHYTCASCSHRDHFCKRIGRMVAEGRLNKGKEVFVYPSNDLKKFAEAVFSI